MLTFKNLIVTSDHTIREVLKIIDNGKKQIALVVDENERLIGTINDGDVRRALLNGIELDDNIENVYFKSPTIATISDTKEQILKLATIKKLHQIPLVDNDGKLVGLDVLDELIISESKKNRVILMVGGLGKRLRPLTENIPKPMLKVGNQPILQTIVEKFVEYGFVNITMCVNYKSHIIQDYFGDGSIFGANIDYIVEETRMGTSGALSLLSEKPTEPFFVMNGDLLTNVNFEHLLQYHESNKSLATMCVREYDFQVPYGVVNIDNNTILSIEEKPVHKFFVNAGIYMLSPEVLKHIPQNKFFDMPTLFERLIEEGKHTVSFPIREYWIDIGHIDEYKKANNEYHKVF